MATIYKTPQSRFWFARFNDGSGKRISKTTKTESKREAKRIAADLESKARKDHAAKEDDTIPRMILSTVKIASLEMEHGRLTLQRAEELIRLMHQAANPNDTGTSFRRFAGAWLDAKEASIAQTTWRSYRDAIKAACTVFGTKADGALRQITVGDIEKFQATIRKRLRGKTTNYYVSVIRRVFENAAQKDLVAKNPARPVKPIGTGDSLTRNPFTLEEVRALIKHATTPEWKGMILLGAHTGLRRGDLLGLTSDNIVGTKIQIQPSKTSDKAGTVLEIPLTPPCLGWLEGRTGDLFPKLKPLKSSTLSEAFKAIMRKAKVPQTLTIAAGDPPVIAHRSFHSLRHTFASWLAEADIHSDVRRKLTGHASEAVHARYTHHDTALVRAVETLPAL